MVRDNKVIPNSAVENLNRVQMRGNYVPGDVPSITFYNVNKEYLHDLTELNISPYQQTAGNSEKHGEYLILEGYLLRDQDGHRNSHEDEISSITVYGDDSLKKLAQAGVDFPGAKHFGYRKALSR